MKKFFIIIILVFIILAIGLVVFALTFDPNRYKDVLIQRIEGGIGKDVKIGSISLSLFPGLGAKVQGVAIKDTDKEWQDALLKASSIDVTIKILPLLRKDIQIQNIAMEGVALNISQDSLKVPTPTIASQNTASTGGQAMAAFKFLAKNMYLSDCNIRYTGKLTNRPMDIEAEILSAGLRNISLYGPVNIDARLSVFGKGRENIKLKAILYPEIDTKSPSIRNLEITIPLDRFDIEKAVKAFGITGLQQIEGKKFSGELVVRSEKLYLSPERLYDSNISVDLSNATTDILPIKLPLQDIYIKSEFNKGDVEIKNFTGTIGKGNFSAKGSIKDVVKTQDLNLSLRLNNIDIADFLQEAKPNEPSFKARLNLDLTCSAKGLTQQGITGSLGARGKLRLEDAVLNNMNVLRTALDKLSMLPGLVQRLKDNLPEYYSELLKQDYTLFKPMDTDFELRSGRVYFEKFIIESDAFYLVTKGSLGLGGDLDASSNLFIPKDLSAAFIDTVPEFKFLLDNNGTITMPLSISGRMPNITVMPNLDYVIQKLAVSKGQELIDRLFRKEESGQQGSESEAGQGQEKPRQERPVETILRGILDIIAEPSQEKEGTQNK